MVEFSLKILKKKKLTNSHIFIQYFKSYLPIRKTQIGWEIKEKRKSTILSLPEYFAFFETITDQHSWSHGGLWSPSFIYFENVRDVRASVYCEIIRDMLYHTATSSKTTSLRLPESVDNMYHSSWDRWYLPVPYQLMRNHKHFYIYSLNWTRVKA